MFLSILGMYEHDASIFKGFTVPNGVDRETCINNILLNCAELEIMYPDFDTMKLAITVWATANLYKWTKLYETTKLVYNPIWNVDADITDTITGSEKRNINRVTDGSNNRTIDLADNETVNLTDSETVDLTDGRTLDLTDTESVKGFNSTSWSDSKKITKGGTDDVTHSGTDDITHTGTDNTTHKGTDKTAVNVKENTGDDVVKNEKHTTRRTGNIGVTTTQQMIEQERNIAEFSIIEYITQSFKERFCLLIY